MMAVSIVALLVMLKHREEESNQPAKYLCLIRELNNSHHMLDSSPWMTSPHTDV